MNLLPQPAPAEVPVVVVDGRPGTEVLRQHPPGTSRPRQVQDPVDRRPHVGRARTAAPFGRRNHWFDQLPLLIREIAWVSIPVHVGLYRPNRDFSYTLLKQKLTRADMKRLVRMEQVIESNHYDILIHSFKNCGQLYLHCYIEVLYLGKDGNDDNWDFYTPVTAQEADIIRVRPSEAREIVDSRRHITCHPDGAIYWTDMPEIAVVRGPG